MNKRIIFLLLLFCATSARAQTVNENLWVTNGTVIDVATVGNTAYIGGSFTQVGPATGSGVALDATSGVRDAAFPKVAGHVYAVVPDGSGGWIIGGSFTAVGGVPRNRLARIRADKTLDPNWNPDVNGRVNALAVSGGVVYAGGEFTTVNGGAPRNYLAAFDLTTGTATAWNPNVNSTVNALAVSGGTLYAGGFFTTVNGGIARNYLAAFDLTTGTATAWNPDVSGGFLPVVYALAVVGSTIYAGGGFTTVNGSVPRNNLAAFDLTTGTATAWNPNVSGTVPIVFALAVSGGVAYAGGQFTTVNGSVSRNNLAAFDLTTGAATAWNPNVFGNVRALAVSGGVLYAGGSFTTVGGSVSRNNLAAFDLTTGTATAWNPNANSPVFALAVVSSTIYAGGLFTTVGGSVPRNRLAAFDLTTGAVTAWNPDVGGGDVRALAVSGGVLYAGGLFTTVNGSITRNRLAAFDLTTGAATSWNPNMGGGGGGGVRALAVSGGVVYAGGQFTTVNGSVSRNNLAAFDLTTGAATAWNPNVNSGVLALAVSGGVAYAGGEFTTVGGSVPRNRLAAFDLTTGAATSWNPNVNGTVRALAVSGGTLYAGGNFTGVSNLAQSYFAGISAFTFPDYAGPTSGIASGTYNNVTFTASGNLPSNVTVNGTLTLNSGVVSNLNGHTITVTNDASNAVAGTGFLTGSGSLARFFNGNQAYAFPYSQAGNDHTATVQFTSGAGTGALTYQFFNTPPGNAGLPQTILGQTISVVAPFYWRIDATGAPGDYTLSLRGQNAGGISNVSALRIVKRANGGSWSATGAGTGTANTGTAADPTVVQSGITGFSEFTIGSDPASNPLPVELASFTGEAVREGVRLVWTTASELNNAGFEVQRRIENVGAGIENDWQVLGFVKGKGTTSEAQSYSFVDRTASGKMQYRLKQVDFDGSFEYSPIIEVEAGLPRTFELSQNYPNPFNPTTVIGYQLPVASEVRLKIYDMLGREVATLVSGRQEAGRYGVPFNASGLASGVYFYRLQAGSFAETKKMLLVK